MIKTIGVINGNIKYPCVLAHIVEEQRTEKYKIVTYNSRVSVGKPTAGRPRGRPRFVCEDGVVWTGLIWLMTGTRYGFIENCCETLRFF